MTQYGLKWFELKWYRDKIAVYGVGQPIGHVKDWRGGNYNEGRIPDSPLFETEEKAVEWLWGQVGLGKLERGMILPGHWVSGRGSEKDIRPVYFDKKGGLRVGK